MDMVKETPIITDLPTKHDGESSLCTTLPTWANVVSLRHSSSVLVWLWRSDNLSQVWVKYIRFWRFLTYSIVHRNSFRSRCCKHDAHGLKFKKTSEDLQMFACARPSRWVACSALWTEEHFLVDEAAKYADYGFVMLCYEVLGVRIDRWGDCRQAVTHLGLLLSRVLSWFRTNVTSSCYIWKGVYAIYVVYGC